MAKPYIPPDYQGIARQKLQANKLLEAEPQSGFQHSEEITDVSLPRDVYEEAMRYADANDGGVDCDEHEFDRRMRRPRYFTRYIL